MSALPDISVAERLAERIAALEIPAPCAKSASISPST